MLKNTSVPQGAQYELNRTVIVEGIIRADRTFISKIIQSEEKQGGGVIIDGIFRGTADNGDWIIGGVPVSKPGNINPVPEGTSLKLTGLIQNGVFVVARQEIGDVRKDVRISGRLAEVNKDITSIGIDVAGAKITVRLKEVSVMTDSGKTLEKSILRSLTGRDIKLGDLRISNGILSTSKIWVGDENLTRTTDESSDNKTTSGRETTKKDNDD